MNRNIATPWDKDKMGRQGVARFLTKYLDSNQDINVLNVNAPWGAGKTFFLENWHADLLQERAVIYFNAWKNDYAGDAFLALTAAIHDALNEFIPTAEIDAALDGFRKKATSAIIAATPTIAKGVLKKITGIDITAITERVETDSLADAAEKAVDELLKNNKKTVQSVNDFKANLSELIERSIQNRAALTKKEPRPLYIFIDELDRCRPTFSIELLERIKHFFDIKNCKFIIACDLEQLQHSVTAIYGNGFDGAKYLKRFFDTEYSLSYRDTDTWIKAQDLEITNCADLPISLEPIGSDDYWPGAYEPIAPSSNAVMAGSLKLTKRQVILLAVAQTFKLKLRELEKCLKHAHAIRTAMPPHEFDFFFAIYLIALRDEAPDLYRKILEQNERDAWGEIVRRYPGKELYCGISNDNVHTLAQKYISLLHMKRAEIVREIRNNDGPQAWLHFILERFSNSKYEVTTQYPRYVDLAHSIE